MKLSGKNLLNPVAGIDSYVRIAIELVKCNDRLSVATAINDYSHSQRLLGQSVYPATITAGRRWLCKQS